MTNHRTRSAPDAKLLGWLEGRPARLERFLEANPQAVERLDELTALGAAIAPALEEITRPAADLQARLVARLAAPPSEVPMLILDLMGLAMRTATVLVNPDLAEPGVDR